MRYLRVLSLLAVLALILQVAVSAPVRVDAKGKPTPTPTGTTRYVSTTGNDNAGANTCTDQTAPCATITQALNSAGTGDTISIGSGQYNESLVINQSVTLAGAGAGNTTLSPCSGCTDHVIYVNSGSNVTIKDLTVSGGATLNQYDDPNHDSTQWYGGGIYINVATVTLTNTTVTGNTAYYGGGGIYERFSTLTLNGSTVTSNTFELVDPGATTGGDGGGIFADNGTVTLNNSTVSNNGPATHGGGIFNPGGTVTLNSSTITGNSGYFGGGLGVYGPVNLKSSTVSNNTATGTSTDGGGGGIFIYQGGNLTASGSTVTGNSTSLPGGGGIYNNGGAATIQSHTQVTGNTPDNCDPPGTIKGCRT